ncbi:MAG TPA: hypothetical protein VEH00_02750 [Steroidobacteraceae bacterium]|nr:hypothetical protein [Steroidobacteraceae bacterium]
MRTRIIHAKEGIAVSRIILTLSLGGLLCGLAGARADEAPTPFDGVWSTVVTCPAADGALPYSYEFLSNVKGGVLHGERGAAGAPGWLQFDGRVLPDGSVSISAHGIVGSERAAVGERPRGTPYSYHVEAKLAGDSGSGHRTRGRNCAVAFSRKAP